MKPAFNPDLPIEVRLWVSKIPFSATEDQLEEHCSDAGEVTEVDIKVHWDTLKPRGFAYVTVRVPSGVDPQDAADAINGTWMTDLKDPGGTRRRKIVCQIAREDPQENRR